MIVAREKADYYGLPQTPPQRERPKSRRRTVKWVRQDRLAFTGMVLLVFCACVIISSYYALVFSTSYRLNLAREQLDLLRLESHALYTKVNQLSGLDYIELAAVEKLGMVLPETDNVVVVQAVAAPTDTDAVKPRLADSKVPRGEKPNLTDPQSLSSSQNTINPQNQIGGQNPVIKALADMVERLEKSIRTG